MITNRERRKFRVRNKISACNKSLRPRLVVSRSNKNIYAQLIDIEGNVMASFSSLGILKNDKTAGVEKSKAVGKGFTEVCLSKNIKEVVFDKGSYNYNGRVKALADACRESGLQF